MKPIGLVVGVTTLVLIVGLASCDKGGEARAIADDLPDTSAKGESENEILEESLIDEKAVRDFWEKKRYGEAFGDSGNYIAAFHFDSDGTWRVAYEGAGYYLKPIKLDFGKDRLTACFLKVWIGAGEVGRDEPRTVTKLRAEIIASSLIERIKTGKNLVFSITDSVSVDFGIVGSMYPLRLNEGISQIDSAVLPPGSGPDSEIDIVDLVEKGDKAAVRIAIGGAIIESQPLDVR